MTVQNEPEFPAPWEACQFTPETQSTFVEVNMNMASGRINAKKKLIYSLAAETPRSDSPKGPPRCENSRLRSQQGPRYQVGKNTTALAVFGRDRLPLVCGWNGQAAGWGSGNAKPSQAEIADGRWRHFLGDGG